MTSDKGERVRLRHIVQQLRDVANNLDLTIVQAETMGVPIGQETAQALTTFAGRVVWHVASHDAYLRASGRPSSLADLLEPDDTPTSAETPSAKRGARLCTMRVGHALCALQAGHRGPHRSTR